MTGQNCFFFSRLHFYAEAKLVDGKTRHYKDRRGLEQEVMEEVFLFERMPVEIASIALKTS